MIRENKMAEAGFSGKQFKNRKGDSFLPHQSFSYHKKRVSSELKDKPKQRESYKEIIVKQKLSHEKKPLKQTIKTAESEHKKSNQKSPTPKSFSRKDPKNEDFNKTIIEKQETKSHRRFNGQKTEKHFDEKQPVSITNIQFNANDSKISPVMHQKKMKCSSRVVPVYTSNNISQDINDYSTNNQTEVLSSYANSNDNPIEENKDVTNSRKDQTKHKKVTYKKSLNVKTKSKPCKTLEPAQAIKNDFSIREKIEEMRLSTNQNSKTLNLDPNMELNCFHENETENEIYYLNILQSANKLDLDVDVDLSTQSKMNEVIKDDFILTQHKERNSKSSETNRIKSDIKLDCGNTQSKNFKIEQYDAEQFKPANTLNFDETVNTEINKYDTKQSRPSETLNFDERVKKGDNFVKNESDNQIESSGTKSNRPITAVTWKTWRDVNQSDAYTNVKKYIEDNELMDEAREKWIQDWVDNLEPHQVLEDSNPEEML